MLDKAALLLAAKWVPDGDFGNVELACLIVNSKHTGNPHARSTINLTQSIAGFPQEFFLPLAQRVVLDSRSQEFKIAWNELSKTAQEFFLPENTAVQITPSDTPCSAMGLTCEYGAGGVWYSDPNKDP